MIKFSYCLYFILAVILVSNLPLFDFFLQEDYTYRNSDGNFYFNEEGGKGRSYEGCLRLYAHFQELHPQEKNKQLYRTFTIKPWRFWEWREMIFHPARFRLPYLQGEQDDAQQPAQSLAK